MQKLLRALSHLLVLALLFPLAGCNLVVMSPSGDVAMQQRDLILLSTGLMLLIIVPVIALTLYFAWHYRRENTAATYDPEWHHSMRLEVVIWSAPLAIIIALGAITWMSTHKLDPFRPLDRIAAGKPVPAGMKPLEVEVVALDWKWLFIYPEQGIASVNEMAAPVDRPIEFKITATSVMNSFYVPALAGQIYAMPGMETKLNAVINHEGVFEGFSANYSGAGFSHMRFKFHAVSDDGFGQWVARVKSQGTMLNRDQYLKLERPSEREPVRYYAGFADNLFHDIVNLCVSPGKMCIDQMMHTDMTGGAGKESEGNVEKLRYDGRYTEIYDKFHLIQGKKNQGKPLPWAEPTADAGSPTAEKATGQSSEDGAGAMQGMDHNGHADAAAQSPNP